MSEHDFKYMYAGKMVRSIKTTKHHYGFEYLECILNNANVFILHIGARHFFLNTKLGVRLSLKMTMSKYVINMRFAHKKRASSNVVLSVTFNSNEVCFVENFIV